MKGFRFITSLFNVFYKSKLIKNDPEKQPKCVRFGVSSVILTILTVIFAAGGALLFKFSLENADKLFILFIFAMAFGVGFMVCALLMFISALVHSIAQMRVNKKPIGIISLILALLGLVGAVAVVILLLG